MQVTQSTRRKEEEYEEIEADFNENDEEKLPEPPKIEEDEPDLDGDF